MKDVKLELKSIFLNSNPITVKWFEESHEASGVFGAFSFQDNIIKLGLFLAEKPLKQVLLHEVVHAMDAQNGGLESLSEAQTDLFANGMLSFIRENKELIKWIMRD